MKRIWVFLGLAISLFSSSPVLADCMELGMATSWYVQGGHTVIFYRGIRPIAKVDVPYCAIRPDSQIQLTKSYMCDTDKIIIDGEACTIMTITSGSGSSF